MRRPFGVGSCLIEAATVARGLNAKEITAQVKNIAAAWIYFSYWGEKRISMRKEFIASTVDFWIDKDERQTTLWNPTMELGDNFYNLIQVTNMPFNMHHVVQLQRSPRRMDLYLFLCNRTPRIIPVRQSAWNTSTPCQSKSRASESEFPPQNR